MDDYNFGSGSVTVTFIVNLPSLDNTAENQRLIAEALVDAVEAGTFIDADIELDSVVIGSYGKYV